MIDESLRPVRYSEVYVSVDIEADGPIPGPNSMRSLGAVATAPNGGGWVALGQFSANILPIDGATVDPATMEWWGRNPHAWADCIEGARPAKTVMSDFVSWLDTLPGPPVFVAYPAGFDFTFVYWYLMRYVGRSPFSHSALDLKTLAMVLLRKQYRSVSKRYFVRWNPGGLKHSHRAIEDAHEQSEMFRNMFDEMHQLTRDVVLRDPE